MADNSPYPSEALAAIRKALHRRLCPRPDRCLYQGDHFAHAAEIAAALDEAGYEMAREAAYRIPDDVTLNRLAQTFYEASGIQFIQMTDKPRVVRGLRAVFGALAEEAVDG